MFGSLAAIAKKRPLHYYTIFSALLDFNPNFETVKGCHVASVQYSLRTAFLGFLRCTYPTIMEVKFLALDISFSLKSLCVIQVHMFGSQRSLFPP